MAEPPDQSRLEDDKVDQPQPEGPANAQDQAGDQEQPDEPNDDEGIAGDADEEELPTFEDEFIQQFLNGRNALVAEEKQRRSDRLFRANLSPVAAMACDIADQIRIVEKHHLWTKEYEESLAENERDIYPGMMFTLAKEQMEKSKLWRIIRNMPKGALLHCHLEAMVDLDWLFEEVLNTEGMCISAEKPLATARDRERVSFLFEYTKERANSDVSIWSDVYPENTCVPVQDAAIEFPERGPEGFMAWLKSRCTVTSEESLKHHLGPNHVWRKFASTFDILASAIFYEPIFRGFVQRLCRQLVNDGVQWVDLRCAFNMFYTREGAEQPDDDFVEMLQALDEEIDLAKYSISKEGRQFWGARMIWTTLRSFDKQTVIGHMRHCIEMKKLFPHLIAGYDLVGQEDLGRPLKDLTPELFHFKKTCLEEGVNIPFFFHAGETLGDGDEADENLFDAILFGTRRIGHGYSLYKHPLLIDMVKDKRILVESCPISNEILRLTPSIMHHPLPALLARGVPVALCNDDPAVLGQGVSGMSHDFWQALQGWENLGMAGLGSLAENSVRWAAYEDCRQEEWVQQIKDGLKGKGIRAQRMKEWREKWENFCAWVVAEFYDDPLVVEYHRETRYMRHRTKRGDYEVWTEKEIHAHCRRAGDHTYVPT